MDSLLRDLRFSARSLLRRPVLSMTAIAALALGIGAYTPIFTRLNALAVNRLPVTRAQELVSSKQETASGLCGWRKALLYQPAEEMADGIQSTSVRPGEERRCYEI